MAKIHFLYRTLAHGQNHNFLKQNWFLAKIIVFKKQFPDVQQEWGSGI
jgi:hypothetical protein